MVELVVGTSVKSKLEVVKSFVFIEFSVLQSFALFSFTLISLMESMP